MSLNFHDLGPLEMEILGILKQESGLSVSEVQGRLLTHGQTLAYTTVMTVLSRLYNKNYLSREKEGRQYFYSVGNTGKKAGASFLNKVSASLFKDNKLKPILTLIEDGEDLSRDELLELKRVIASKLKEENS